MPAELSFGVPALFGFLLVLTRISSALVFVPMPSVKGVADAAKATFCVFTTLALFPFWPAVTIQSMGQLTGWLCMEAAFGLTVGLTVAFLSEAFILGAQAIGLQAGYSYASTIDPISQNDTTVFQTIMQLLVGFFFFTAGLDRYVIRVFARTLEVFPPGKFRISEPILAVVSDLGTAMFSTGLRLALPVIALLLLIDISLALLGRVNAQLQLLSLAFPVKMLGALVALAATVAVFPAVYEKTAQQMIASLMQVLR